MQDAEEQQAADPDGPATAAPPEIRDARPDERSAVSDLLRRTYVDGGLVDAGSDYAERLADVETWAENGQVLVALDGRDLLGCVVLLLRRGPLSEVAQDAEEVEFRLLAVEREHRRRGVARLLVGDCIARARRARAARLVLPTTDEMTAAHELYRHLGFVEQDDRAVDLPNGVHLRVFVLELAAGPVGDGAVSGG